MAISRRTRAKQKEGGEEWVVMLPEDCIAAIISFTSPRDACRFASVSTIFRSAAESDAIWGRFLPPEYVSAIAESGAGLSSAQNKSPLSKKELYLRACHEPVLIDQGKLSFWLDKPSGKKCYMISPRELKIVWGDTPRYWNWISLPDARFPEVAMLVNVCWFEMRGEINTSLLSPSTIYVAYLVFKPTDVHFGFKDNPVEVTIELDGIEDQKRIVYLDTSRQRHILRRRVKRASMPMRSKKRGDMRGDGWFETELGEIFSCGDKGGELITVGIMETKSGNWKYGLVFQGIEIRPKKV